MSVAEPSRPSTFIFIPNDSQPGVYLVPSDVFRAARFEITPLFHRMFTSVDHLLAAVLTLIILSVLTSAAHTILLRTTSHNPDSPLPSRTRLLSAALLLDIFHLRLPLNFFQRQMQPLSQTRAFNPRPPPTLPQLPVPFLLAVVVFVTTFAVASINLLILVVASYTRPTPSTRTQYALHGIQPIVTSTTTSRRITRLAMSSICTSPLMTTGLAAPFTSASFSFPQHKYLLTTCVYADVIQLPISAKITRNFEGISVTSTHLRLSLSSTFHSKGADHSVTIGNKTITVHVRVTISHVYSDGNVIRKPMPFRILDSDAQRKIQYLHERAAYFAYDFVSQKVRKYEFTRKQRNPQNTFQQGSTSGNSFSERDNTQKIKRFVNRSLAPISRHQSRISTAKRKCRMKAETVFLLKISEQQYEGITAAHEAALDSLIPTMGIIEAEGGSDEALRKALKSYLNVSLSGAFSDQKNESLVFQEEGNGVSYKAEGLVQQEGRTAGVALLAVVAATAIVVLTALRWKFRPTSLGELAWQHLEGVQSRREWLASHPQRSGNIQEDRFPKDSKHDDTFSNSEPSDENAQQTLSHAQSDDSSSSIGIDATMRRSMSVYVCPPTDI